MPFILAAVLGALLLEAMVLPDVFADWRPAWLLLVSLYWVINVTHRYGMGWCWIVGLLLDALTASPLGLHALCFLIVGGIAWRFSVLVRVFGLMQQGVVVIGLVLLSTLMGFMLQWLTGHPTGHPPGWLALGTVLSSAVVWLPSALVLRWLQGFIEQH